jgi:DNA primase small subunit
MDEKGWQGADLIFDLDGDHLPGVTDRDFPEMLNQIQVQAWRLWNDFLEPDFGFEEKYLQLSFSGHRGFHLHYRNPELWSLDRDARRELVSHITGDGISVEAVLRGGEHGWRRRIEQGVINVLDRLKRLNQGDETQRKILRSFIENRKKAPDSQAKRVTNSELDDLAKKSQDSESRKRLMQPQYRRQVFGKRLNNIFWELVRGDSSVILAGAGETDESVTVDIKRVIRWITSLHGKSGLRVTEFPLSRLDPDGSNPFDALQETLPFGLGTSQQLLLKVDNITARIGDEEISGSTGQTVYAHEPLAMFLVLKGWAEPLSG